MSVTRKQSGLCPLSRYCVCALLDTNLHYEQKAAQIGGIYEI